MNTHQRLLQGNTLYQHTGAVDTWQWSVVGTVLQQVQGNVVELAIDRQTIGKPTDIHLFFAGDNLSLSSGVGTTNDYYPNAVYDANSAPRYFRYTTEASLATTTENLPAAALAAQDEPINGRLALMSNAQPLDISTESEQGNYGVVEVGGGVIHLRLLLLLSVALFIRGYLIRPSTSALKSDTTKPMVG